MLRVKMIMNMFLFAAVYYRTSSGFASTYLIGFKAFMNITGPAAEIVMMGYDVSSQKNAGIHTRLRCGVCFG